VALACATLAGLALAAALAPASATAQVPQAGKILIFQHSYLDGFRRWDRKAAERLFNNERTYVLVTRDNPSLPPGWRARPTLMYRFLRHFKRHVQLGAIPPAVSAVIYNHEPNWTPARSPEARHPQHFVDEFARVAHSRGLTFISAPGGCVAPMPSGRRCDATYLRAGARRADIVDLQIQRSQGRPREYVWRLRRAIEQIEQVNPAARIVTQTTSNPTYVRPDVGPTVASLLRSASLVDGFWPYIYPDGCRAPCPINESSRNGYVLLSAIDELGLHAVPPLLTRVFP
jgi:hypothetical protein